MVLHKQLLYLLDKYEEDIENLLMKRVKDTEREICFKLAKACTDKIIAKDSKAASNTKDKDSKTEL